MSSLGVVDSINNGNWSKVIIQTWEDAYRDNGDTNPEECVQYSDELFSLAKNVGAEPMVFFPQMKRWIWEKSDSTKVATAFQTHAMIEQITGAFVMPCHTAWMELGWAYLRGDYPGGWDAYVNLVYHDWGHQNTNGMLLNTFVCYTILTGGKSPVGLRPQWPNAIYNSTTSSDPYNPDMQDVLAQLGYEVGMAALDQTVPTVPVAQQVPRVIRASGVQKSFSLLGRHVPLQRSTPRSNQLIVKPGHSDLQPAVAR
jgi:hypothetical protein